jgi:NADH-quinone oxidoreductase subunit H
MFKNLNFLISTLILLVGLLLLVAFFTLAERKILGVVQFRHGPNVIGFYGLLQPLSDGLKLLIKEPLFPSNSDKIIFFFAPIITFLFSLINWVVIPFSKFSFITELSLSSLYILAGSALGIYGILTSGWASNSKYALLGALRSAAQMVSYELPIGLILNILICCIGSFNINSIIYFQEKTCWLLFIFPLLFLSFFICIVAETNRHPFDLPEAETELVSGYNVEYGAMSFALFSLGEYSNILLMSSFTIILFFGGWLAPLTILNFLPFSFWFAIKIIFFICLFVLLRAGLPRYRYDQLMELGWKILLPCLFGFFIFNYSILLIFNFLPF